MSNSLVSFTKGALASRTAVGLRGTGSSPSLTQLTLKHVAEAELLEREMDWIAIQRLKGWGLLADGGTRLKLTQAGRDALRRLIAR